MRSSFSKSPRRITSTASSTVDENYDLRGLNLIAPDQVMPKGESPHARNNRMYARNDGETRVALRSRKGSAFLSTPVGETANVSNTDASTGSLVFSASSWIFQSFTPDADGALTKLEVEIKKQVSGNGHVIVEVYADNSGSPGLLLAQSSILSTTVTDSLQYLPVYFMDAPELTSGTVYWKLLKTQEHGTATYALNKVAGTNAQITTDELVTYTSAGGDFRYKTYLSTPGEIIGYARRYPQNNVNRTFFVLKDASATNLYSVTDAGTPTSIDATISTFSERVRMDQVDDKLIYVDGFSPAKWYNGTAVSEIANVAGNPTNVIIFKNRAMFIPDSDPNRVNFSELYNFESYPSVNFFYVPNPKSPDHIAGWKVHQDNLNIFTHETKYMVYGSSISTFTMKEAVGTKGAVSQEAIAVGREGIYFMSDDKQIYLWNGVYDKLISSKVEPELSSIQDVNKVRMHIYRNQLRVYYPKSPSTVADRMLLLDIESEQWFLDTGRSVMGSLEWYLDDNQLIEFSSRTGQMFLGETGNSDIGKAIDFEYYTSYKAYTSGAAKDRIKRFRPIVRPSSSPYYLLVGKDVNFEDSATMTPWLVDAGGAKWGQFLWGDGTKWGSGKKMIDAPVAMSGRGNHTQYRFKCEQVGVSVELYGYIALVKSGRAR